MSAGETSASGAGWRIALVSGALALALLVPIAARVAVDGRSSLAAAQDAREAGDRQGEILHLGRAARWFMPVARHDDAARERLGALALEAQAEAGPAHAPEALAAWRELRRALFASRGVLGIRDEAALAEANAGIVSELERQAVARGEVLDTARIAAELDAPPLGPQAPWGHLSALAFVAWIGASAGLFVAGFDAEGKLRRGRALAWGIAALSMLALWLMTS